MVSRAVCYCLSWVLEQVAVSVAQVIELGTVHQYVLLVFYGCC